MRSLLKNIGSSLGWKSPQKVRPTIPKIPSRMVFRVKKAERAQTFSKVFRWRPPAGQTQKPATVEVVGTFTQWEKVPLVRDGAPDAWHVMLHSVPCNQMHHYMLLVDGQPVPDEHCDGLAVPCDSREAQYQLMTERGPRVFILFAQAK